MFHYITFKMVIVNLFLTSWKTHMKFVMMIFQENIRKTLEDGLSHDII